MDYLSKHKRKGAGKYTWTLNPPSDIKKAGLAHRQVFYDGRTAKAAARALKIRVKEYRNGNLAAVELPDDCTFLQLAANYFSTAHFNSLSGSTREAYINVIASINEEFGNKKVKEVTSRQCNEVYTRWVQDHGAAWANKRKRLFGVLLAYAVSMDVATHNPMSSVKAVKHEPTTVEWTPEQVEKFLKVCFEDFRYRNLGIIVLLCYSWAQRPVDIQRLKWENIDFETNTVTIKQKKRGAVVHLPIDEDLKVTLAKQKKDFDFQEYVAPYFRKSDSAYRPFTSSSMSPLVKEVLNKAGLPDNLEVGSLRKTVIMEMVEAGLDGVQMLPVTGHKSVVSLNPYLKYTKKAAKSALDVRRKHVE